MREISFGERLREFLTSRRFLWALTIALGVLVVLYFLFITFFFNPFEDDLEDTAAVVPQEVDYFFRWQDAGAHFDGFPVPKAWSEFAKTGIYQTLSASGDLQRWGQEKGVSQAIDDLRRSTTGLPEGLSLERDLLREVVLTGNGRPVLDASFDGMLMMRVSFKVKAGVSLLHFGFVRDKLPEDFALESLGGDRYKLPQFPAFGYQDAYLARVRDVLLLASKPEWLDRVHDLEIRSGEESLAHASRFHDNVTALLAPGDEPVEMFVRWDDVGPLIGSWPDAQGATSFSGRLPAHFFTTDLLRYASGFLIPGERFEGRLAGEIDPSKASDFERSWYDSQSLSPAKIKDFAEMIPGDSFFYGAFSGDAGRLLQELLACLDDDLRRLLEDTIVNAGTYQGTAQLLDEVSNAFAPGVFVGMRRFEYEPSEARDTPHDDKPAPVFVFIATLRNKDAYDRLMRYVDTQFRAGRLGADVSDAKVQEVGIYGGMKVVAFASQAIPGTGEFVVLQFPARNAVLVTNSYRYMEQVVKTAFSVDHPVERDLAPPLVKTERFQQAMEAIERTHSSSKAFLYFDPSEARQWFDKLSEAIAKDAFDQEQEAGWASGGRVAEEAAQRARLFPGPGELSMDQENQLKDAVDKALLARKDELAGTRVPELREQAQRGFLPLQVLDWVCLSFLANRKDASLLLSGRLQFD